MDKNQIIETLKAQVLQESREFLVRKDLKRYLPHLKSKYMISLDDQEEIESLKTTSQRDDMIIDILLKRGPHAYDHLCTAMLNQKVDANVVTKLNIMLENKCSETFGAQEPLRLVEDFDTSQLPIPSSVSVI